MISADTIRTIAATKSIHPGVIEKDYVLSKTLISLAAIPAFQKSLVFKGGTALKKCYYPNWRYSEDLDFTARHKLSPAQIQEIFRLAAEGVNSTFGLPLRIGEYSQYPKGTDDIVTAQLKLSYDGPLRQSSGQKNNIRVDITLDEEINDPAPIRDVLQEYADDITATLPVYSLEEIVAEKLRSILQRGKSRDYHDVWVLLTQQSADFDWKRTRELLSKKCRFKNIPEPGLADFFQPEQLDEARRFWERGLAHQMASLPDFDEVVRTLKIEIGRVLGTEV